MTSCANWNDDKFLFEDINRFSPAPKKKIVLFINISKALAPSLNFVEGNDKNCPKTTYATLLCCVSFLRLFDIDEDDDSISFL